MPNTTSTEPAGQAPLRLGPLLHPAEFSRMLLALSAVVISIGVYVAFLLALGGPTVLVVATGFLLFLVGIGVAQPAVVPRAAPGPVGARQ
jgi:hypothetical protein